jgi:N-methylhydantoinase A
MKGGTLPAGTDANLVLGYLDPAYFAGGRMPLSLEAARTAIATHIAQPMGLSVEEAAAGMYRVVCNNMAQGVREVTIKRGYDPREFPFIAAGGAGPIHSCQICNELEIPLQIVPRESSALCAMGMLLSDLQHDFVRTFVADLATADWDRLAALIDDMVAEGDRQLVQERIPADRRRFAVKLDCRYVKQYHEVSVDVPRDAIGRRDAATVAQGLHREHNRLYGYSLEHEKAAIEIINVRVQAVGSTDKPRHPEEEWTDADVTPALKGRRRAYVPEDNAFRTVPIYDGHQLHFGQRIAGPAIIEQVTTAVVLTASFDAIVDRYGSFVLHRKGREDLIAGALDARIREAVA